MNSLTFKRISTWGKFVGISTMILGAISAISGLVFFIVGAIPGVLMTWLGYMIYKSSQEADAFMEDHNEVHVEELLNAYGRLLKFYGIYTIISVALSIPFFLFVLFSGIATL